MTAIKPDPGAAHHCCPCNRASDRSLSTSNSGPRRAAVSRAALTGVLLLALSPVGDALADNVFEIAAPVPSEALLAERHLAARLDWRSYYLDRLDRQDRIPERDVAGGMAFGPPAGPPMPLGSSR